VAVAPNSAFVVDSNSVDSVVVSGYFKARTLDSFFVQKDVAQFQYVSIPVEATAGDDASIREYAMTLYYQLTDSSSTTTFEDMARVSSEDPGSAEKGGVLSDDFVGRGTYVKPFEDVAFALDSGKISEPVRSQFGYHIIKSFGKSTDSTGKVTANVGHILLVVNASSETVDSLEKILTGIKNEVAAGKEFAAAAKERNLEVAESGWVGRNENIPELGYLKGLTSFAWPNENLPEEEGNVSPVLRNSKFVVLANKVKELKAGDRDFDMYFESIKTALKTKKSANAAGIYLNSVADKVKEWKAPAEGDSTATPVAIEKVLVQNMKSSAEGYVNGFGYSSTGLYKVLNGQKVGEWGPVIETDLGAVMVRVNSKTPAEEAAVAAAVKQEYDNGARFFASALFNDFVSKIEKSTPVECNLDLFYRD
jgi:peptidyl-prolyl cis-trans isomerase D